MPVALAMAFPIGSALAIGAQVAAGTSRLPWLSLGMRYTPNAETNR